MIDVQCEHPSWMDYASCHGVGDSFFPDESRRPEMYETIQAAKRVCALCPVRVDCLEYALANNERYGIWGGLSAEERRKLSKTSASDRPVLDHVVLDRVTHLLRHEDRQAAQAFRNLNALEQSIVLRHLVHEYSWTRTKIANVLRMNSHSASHRYEAALQAGTVNKEREIA